MWIKVTERLPEFEKDVLVFGEGRTEKAHLESVITKASGVTCYWFQGYDEIYFTVTHWQEITPPKD